MKAAWGISSIQQAIRKSLRGKKLCAGDPYFNIDISTSIAKRICPQKFEGGRTLFSSARFVNEYVENQGRQVLAARTFAETFRGFT
jgi:hypothetical protein